MSFSATDRLPPAGHCKEGDTCFHTGEERLYRFTSGSWVTVKHPGESIIASGSITGAKLKAQKAKKEVIEGLATEFMWFDEAAEISKEGEATAGLVLTVEMLKKLKTLMGEKKPEAGAEAMRKLSEERRLEKEKNEKELTRKLASIEAEKHGEQTFYREYEQPADEWHLYGNGEEKKPKPEPEPPKPENWSTW